MGAQALQLDGSPRKLQLEKSPHSNEDPAQPKMINKYIFFKKKEEGRCFNPFYFLS